MTDAATAYLGSGEPTLWDAPCGASRMMRGCGIVLMSSLPQHAEHFELSRSSTYWCAQLRGGCHPSCPEVDNRALSAVLVVSPVLLLEQARPTMPGMNHGSAVTPARRNVRESVWTEVSIQQIGGWSLSGAGHESVSLTPQCPVTSTRDTLSGHFSRTLKSDFPWAPGVYHAAPSWGTSACLCPTLSQQFSSATGPRII